MNIGDLYWAFRGDGARLQKDAKVEGAKAGTTLGNTMAANVKKSWSGQQIGKGLVQGLGLAGGLGAAVVASRAISGIADALGDSVKAAIADEASQRKLLTSIKANIPAWDGNTAAIERVLKARMDLGFSDDEQRDSLARIVVATKDVNRALEVQRTAMDLARLKGISLADAGDALIKVEGGQFRALKALGIVLKDGATAQDALLAVQQAAAGQAEDYANTTAGKVVVAQTRINEAMEDFGYRILPLVADALDTLTGHSGQLASIDQSISMQLTQGTLDQLIAARDAIKTGLHELQGSGNQTIPNLLFGDQIKALQADLAKAEVGIAQFDSRSTTAAENIKGAFSDVAAASGTVSDAGDDIAGTTDKVGDHADDMADEIRAAALGSSRAFDDMKKSMVADAGDLIDQAFDPIITKDNLRANAAELAAQREILASSKSTAAQKADARDRIHELTKDNAEYLLSLAEAGQTGSKAYAAGMKELRAEIKKAKGPAKAALQEVLDKIHEIEKAGKSVPINLIVAAQTTEEAKRLAGNMRAGGGPVRANVPYVVGERRAELFVPDVNGRILPSVPGAASMAAAGGAAGASSQGDITVNIGTVDRRTMADLRREMQMIGDKRRKGWNT